MMRNLTLLALIAVLSPVTLADDDKIDAAVTAQLQRLDRAPVILLGRTQMLDGPEAFAAFCEKHKDAKRSELRREVIARLKDIADKEQPAILEALDSPEGARRLWIANAIAVSLTKEQIETAAALDEVKYIYPAGQIPAGGAPGTVSEVLEPPKSKPFSTKEKRVPWNVEMVGASRVWEEFAVHGEGVVVAMYDAGVNYRHEDLRDNIWINSKEIANNGKDDDGNGFVDDLYGYDFVQMKCEVIAGGRLQHGTLTSGIVAGDGTGGIITGLAPRAKLMLIRGFGGPYVAAQAHQYAVEMGADVMNMSFSIPALGNTRGLWRRFSEHAVCAGLVLCSGAGNFQQSARIPVQQRIPEGIPCVISGGGVDRFMDVPNFCSLGPVEWSRVKFYEDHAMPEGLTKPDVCGFPGPGYPVLGSSNSGYVDPNNRIRGNSFSGPHVVGSSALLLSAQPELPAWKVKETLEATATDIGDKGKDNRTGAGLLNAYKAVKSVRKK